MKNLAQLAILAAGVVIGWAAHTQLEPGDPLELEISMNHERCDEAKPVGYTAYPVTFYGELRGCYIIRQDGPEWMPKHAMFRRIK